jgi:hypothetical protein
MTNLVQISEPQILEGESLQRSDVSLGLSYSPYLTVSEREVEYKRLHIKRFATGEVIACTKEVYKPNIDESRQSPPINTGERETEGLSALGRRNIRKAANHYDHIVGERGGQKMITLSYGDTSISGHVESKKDLDRYLKCLCRYVKKVYGIEKPLYTWIAEIQPNRFLRTGEAVIHYHVMTIYYIPYKLNNKWWNNSVNKPRIKAGLPVETLYPHIKAMWSAGAYMTSYLKKEGHKIKGNGFSLSHSTHALIQPQMEECIDVRKEDVSYIYDRIQGTSKHHVCYRHNDEVNEVERLIWIPTSNEYQFQELLNTVRYEQSNQSTQREQGQSTSSPTD